MSTPTLHAHLLDPRRYKATFGRSLRSELRKITSLRSFWIREAIMVLLYAGIISLAAFSQNAIARTDDGPVNSVLSAADAGIITSGVSFAIIFSFIHGIVATTNEYSSNTMRTTSLADPVRTRSYVAKHIAVLITAACAHIVLVAVSTGIYALLIESSFSLDSTALRVLVMFWAVLTIGSVIGTSMGYLIRATAGAITLTFAVFFLANAISFIQIDWVRETLVHYLPYSIVNTATASGFTELLTSGSLSWSAAGLVWLAYAIVLALAGLLKYRSRDI
ncbi:hypothetical protein I6E29_05555 [Arcanobacterium haemolyticum]|nr:hypothetical protein [Arcanobacterium haemolyticum]